MPPISITKRQAARRQLETAIQLFFTDGEPVSIHNLAADAHEVLTAIGRRRGVVSLLKGTLKDVVKPEYQKEYIGTIKFAENFFKHGAKDPEETFEFNPATSTYVMVDCVLMYERLEGKLTGAMLAFKAWFCLSHPEMFDESVNSMIIGACQPLHLDVNKRARFGELIPEFDEIIRTTQQE